MADAACGNYSVWQSDIDENASNSVTRERSPFCRWGDLQALYRLLLDEDVLKYPHKHCGSLSLAAGRRIKD